LNGNCNALFVDVKFELSVFYFYGLHLFKT
jgi:hypothetical protein